MRQFFSLVVAITLAAGAVMAAPLSAKRPAEPRSALARLPVREITAFKDGHTFVLHAGRVPTDAGGNVQLDYLPTPVLGTFWPYSADRSIRLAAVTASPRRVLTRRTALNLRELLEANPGARVRVVQTDGRAFDALVVGVPRRRPGPPPSPAPARADPRSGYEYYPPQAFGAPGQDPALPERGNAALLKTEEGVLALPIERIRALTFRGRYRQALTEQDYRNQLTLKMDWPGGRVARSAEVGMVYLQKGVRWVPNYRLSIDGQGSATVQLQATVINELVDLEDVTANLVIGVPTFYFKDTPDPISLQQTFPQLSRYFQPDSQTGFAFSNALMSQGGFGGFGFPGGIGFGGGAPAGRGGGSNRCGGDGEEDAGAGAEEDEPGAGLDAIETDRNEDLFVFTVKHLTLRKGQSTVLTVAEYPLKYRDVYTLEVAFAPPPEVDRNLSPSQEEEELARLLRAPRAQHKMRLANSSPHPLTTAPALIVTGDRVLSQTLMAYTPAGAEGDLTLTTAPDIRVKKSEREIRRTPDAAVRQTYHYGRVDLAGTLSVTNLRGHPVDLEVTRYLPGNGDQADHDGVVEMMSPFDDDGPLAQRDAPNWWRWYAWPSWWSHFNGKGRITWKVRLAPGQAVDLGYAWHYYWR